MCEPAPDSMARCSDCKNLPLDLGTRYLRSNLVRGTVFLVADVVQPQALAALSEFDEKPVQSIGVPYLRPRRTGK